MTKLRPGLKWFAMCALTGIVAGGAAVWLAESATTSERPTVGANPAVAVLAGPAAENSLPGGSAALSNAGRLATIAEHPSHFERTAMLYDLVRNADVRSLQRMLVDAESLPTPWHGATAKRIVFARYAEVDPKHALAWVRDHANGAIPYVPDLFRAWAVQDLDAALAAAETLADRSRREAATAILTVSGHLTERRWSEIAERLSVEEVLERQRVDEYLEDDPALAWRQAVASEPGEIRLEMLWHVAQTWIKRDPEAAFAALQEAEADEARGLAVGLIGQWAVKDRHAAAAWVVGQPPSPQRSAMVNALAAAVADESPEAALRVADRFAGEDGKRAATAALLAWGRTDARAALEALAQREFVVAHWTEGSLVGLFSRQDPHAAFDWILTKPASLGRPHLLSSALLEMAKSAPHDALRRAQELRGMEREQGIAVVLAEWARSEARAAAGWVARSDSMSSAERQSALQSVLGVWGEGDAPAALNWLLAQPPQWHMAAASVIGALAEGAPERAARLTRRLSNPEVRSEAQRTLAAKWAADDPRAALRWAADVADAGERRGLYSDVFLAWVHQDREAAADSVRLLRSGKERDGVRREMIAATVNEDAEFAERLYLRINDAREQHRAARSLHRYWEGRDAKRARRYARIAGLGESAG